MTEEQGLDRIVEKVQKMLALARRGGTEGEMAAAMAKAQEFLARHNLDMATVEKGPALREKTSQDAGMYIYQRALWKSVADLNFCLCLRTQVWDLYKGRKLLRNKMMVVGRKVNVRATIAMAGYIEQTINRLCNERLATQTYYGSKPGNLHTQFFSGWAVAFREGIADRVVDKVRARRKQRLRAEELQRQREVEAGAASASSSTAISLSVYKDKETDANIDFLHGEGTAAKWAADRAQDAADAAAAEKEYAEWAAAHPEEARKEAEALRKQRISYGRSPRSRRIDWGGYRAGREAGEKVGIDPQAETARAERRIG